MSQDQIENEVGIFSLADLAAMDTSQVKELTSLVPNVGLYHMKGLEVRGGQSTPQEDKPALFFYNFVSEIISAKLVDKTIDAETLVGRRLTDSFTLWPSNFKDLVGLLKGRYKMIGLANTGLRIGGVEGQEPGWLDNWIGAEYDVKVTHFVNKQGEVRARFTYQKAKGPETEAGAAG